MVLQLSMAEGRCVRVARCSFHASNWRWPFAQEHAAVVARDWQRRRAEIPQLFDGTIYLLRDHAIDGEALTGTFFRTDFKSFLYWRDHRTAETETVRESFGASLIRSAEGFVLLGRQGRGQLNSGRAYPPSGLIDGDDARDGTIDIDTSIARELAEETGLGSDTMQRVPGYILALAGLQVAIAAEWQSALPAAQLRERILAFIRNQAEPELDDIVIVRTHADIDARTMPPHARALLRTVLPA